VSQQPESQTLPAQQGPPGVPHAWHTPRQTVFVAVHWLPQQGSPAPPQRAQAPPEHVVPAAVHVFPVQQGCESAPHPPQLL
jgi:hypothetical protein